MEHLRPLHLHVFNLLDLLCQLPCNLPHDGIFTSAPLAGISGKRVPSLLTPPSFSRHSQSLQALLFLPPVTARSPSAAVLLQILLPGPSKPPPPLVHLSLLPRVAVFRLGTPQT